MFTCHSPAPTCRLNWALLAPSLSSSWATIVPNLASALTRGMALVAVHAVVDIARHMIVLKIVRIVAAVTSSALEHGVVIRIRVARRANSIGIAMARRELRVLRMVEGRVAPACCVVAVLARGWEELLLRGVSWIARVLVIRLMTAVAIGGQRCVVTVDVAVGALAGRHRMRSGKGKGCRLVIKR